MADVIRKAQESDIPAIVNLAKKLSLAAQGTNPPSRGFLVSGFDEDVYAKYVELAEHFYVCVDLDSDSLMGFVLAYSDQVLDPANLVEATLKQVYYMRDFVLIKQIAVDPSWQGKGVGTRLYQFLDGRVANVALLAAIVLDPPNPDSIRFHKRFGFRYLLEVKTDDGRPRGIWHRPIQNLDSASDYLRIRIPEETATVDRLQNQFDVATQLYCHEDNLNWVKIGSFLTLIFFLGAAYSFFWQKDGLTKYDMLPICGLFLFGVIVHVVFIFSLLSGLNYMMKRKKSVLLMERLIEALDGNLRPFVKSTRGLSLTARSLYVFPFLSLAAWCVGAALIILRVYK